MSTMAGRPSKTKDILRVIGGNFLEMFDFMVYGFYASYIAQALFPSDNAEFALVMSWATFGIGFLARPLGAIVLGAYTDRHGRRAGLILSLILMAAGVVLIAFVPGYATIGVAAPALVIVGRLLQGFSAGAETGAVSVYLSEIAPPGQKGVYVSLQTVSQQVAVVFAAVIGVGLRFALSVEQMQAWGWRIPFMIGALLVPLILIMRRSLKETEEFKAKRQRPTMGQIYRTLLANWAIVGTAVMMITLTAVTFYLITAYMPTFGKKVLGLGATDGYIVTVCLGFTNIILMPIAGAWSDRIGKAPIMLTAAIALAVLAYPAMMWLVEAPSFQRLLVVELLLGSVYGMWQGVLVGALVDIMPAEVRTAGWSLAYSLTYAIFGGFTPALVTYLIQATGDRAIPGVALTGAAAVGIVGTLLARKYLTRPDVALSLDTVSETAGT